MKNFDEWWNNNQWKYSLSERSPCMIARDSWEAGLRWARSKAFMDPCANGVIIYPDILDKELEEN